MRLWVKYLIGIIIGIVASFLIPAGSVQAQSTLNFIVDLVIRFGRYAIVPVIFFSAIISTYKLNEEKLMFKTTIWTAGVIVVSSLVMVIIGIVSAVLIYLPRIPIRIEKVSETPQLNVQGMLQAIFPYNGVQTLIDGTFMLPVLIFAGLAGYGAFCEKKHSSTTIAVVDSVSRVCFRVMAFITELLSIGMIAIMFKWTTDFVRLAKLSDYNPLFILFFADLLIVAVVIYPIVIRILCHDRHPFRILYGGICSIFMAFFSGDTNATLALNLRLGKENLGIRRRTNAFVQPMFSIFSRGGAALVESICFILILRSYSSLNITFQSVLWIGAWSFLLSFVLGNIPMGGPFFAITVMFTMYGGGFDAGYLLLKDAAPIICCFAATFDAVTALFGSYIVAYKTNTLETREVSRYV